MDPDALRLRNLGLALRVAATCFVLMVGAGSLLSLVHLVDHTGRKDDDPGLAMIDIVGTYHGVNRPAPMLVALDDSAHKKWLATMPGKDRRILRDWLALERRSTSGGDPIEKAYDVAPAGLTEDDAPAEVLYRHCERCHKRGAAEGGGIGTSVALDRWPAVRKHVYSKRLDPVSEETLVTSAHTHVLAIPAYTLLTCLLLLLTRWPRWLRHGLVMVCFLSLLIDFTCWWLARGNALFAYGIAGAGAAYGAALGLALLLTVLDLWLPPGR